LARGRMLDKRISMSKKLGRVSDKAARLWFMILPHLDREGRIAFDDLEDLSIEIIPWLKWKQSSIETALNELADSGLIILYPNKNQIAIQYTKFHDFQSGLHKEREAESKIAAPPATDTTTYRLKLSYLREEKNKLKGSGRKEGSEQLRITPESSGPSRTKSRISFDFNRGKFTGITAEIKKRWAETYPAVDIEKFIKHMENWQIANPKRRKVNYERAFCNWLKEEQDKNKFYKTKRTDISEKKLSRRAKEIWGIE